MHSGHMLCKHPFLVVLIAAMPLFSGCMSYTAPKEGPTAKLAFLYMDYREGQSPQGSVIVRYYNDGKRPFWGGAPIMAIVKPATPETIETILNETKDIPATGEEFVFQMMYGAQQGMTLSSCDVELRFRPEPGMHYVAAINTTDMRCGGDVLRKTATTLEKEPTARSAFNDKPKLPPEPTEPLAAEHLPRPNR